MDKKALQKQRIMTYFIDAATKIIEEEGIENITIRKTANIAGYNSATLYNYFDNLDHLILFASIRYLKDYVKLIPEYMSKASNSLERYFAIWECFCQCSFNSPQIYNLIFFSSFSNSLDNFIEQYYEIFPDELLDADFTYIKNMLLENSIYIRNLELLNECVEEGFIAKENITTINSVTIYMYNGMLNDILKKLVDKSSINEYVDSAMNYIRFITTK